MGFPVFEKAANDTLVAIVTYNRVNSLKTLLTQLNKCGDDFDIIVVDDCSTDGTRQFLRQHGDDYRLNYFTRHIENRGVSYAKNTAIRRAQLKKYEYVFVIEDDVRVKPGFVELYKKAHQVSGIHHFNFLPPEILPQSIYPKPRPDSPYIYGTILDTEDIGGVKIDYWSDLGGTMMFITRDVIMAVGGFNCGFRGRGFNHVEYSLRVARAGLTTCPKNIGGINMSEYFDPELRGLLKGWAHVNSSPEYISLDWLQQPTHNDFKNPTKEDQERLAFNWQVFLKSLEWTQDQLYCTHFLKGSHYGKDKDKNKERVEREGTA